MHKTQIYSKIVHIRKTMFLAQLGNALLASTLPLFARQVQGYLAHEKHPSRRTLQ